MNRNFSCTCWYAKEKNHAALAVCFHQQGISKKNEKPKKTFRLHFPNLVVGEKHATTA